MRPKLRLDDAAAGRDGRDRRRCSSGPSWPSDCANVFDSAAQQFVVGRVQVQRDVGGAGGQSQRLADPLERDLGLLLEFAADDSLGDRGGDGHGRLLPAPQPVGFGVVGFGDELVERGEQRVEPLGDFFVEDCVGPLASAAARPAASAWRRTCSAC